MAVTKKGPTRAGGKRTSAAATNGKTVSTVGVPAGDIDPGPGSSLPRGSYITLVVGRRV